MLKEFKEFALKGNMIDMGVGIIIGTAFGKIVASFVSDILMPPLGLLLGRVDFASLFVVLDGRKFASLVEAKKAGAPTLNYGLFINQTVDFVLVAFALFLLLKQINRLKRPVIAEAAPATKECSFCYSAVPVKATRCPHCTSQLS